LQLEGFTADSETGSFDRKALPAPDGSGRYGVGVYEEATRGRWEAGRWAAGYGQEGVEGREGSGRP